MGLESANYVVVPNAGVAGVDEVLASLGAERRTPFPGSDFPRWVLRSDNYWIDVMVGDLGPERKPGVSIRIALCNPIEAHAQLRDLMLALLESMPGVIFDKQTRRSHNGMSEETWRGLEGALSEKRAEFQRHFGPFEAAISGEDVFSKLKSQN
jgi:hypothetical protein